MRSGNIRGTTMQRKNIVPTLLLLTTLSLAFIFMTAEPVFAASVTLSPDQGKTATITSVSGSGFTASTTYNIYFAYNTSYETRTSGTVATDGSISRSITVPEIPGGSYTVRVATPLESASDTFTVEPQLDLSKTSVVVGEQVTVNGTGFRASRNVTIKFDNRATETTSTNSKGSFSVRFRIPESSYGSHEVTADDGTNRLSIGLSVKQLVTISPKSGTIGTKLAVTGTGFRGERAITITFDGDEVDTNPASITTGNNGSFTASFQVPACINDTAEVVAGDGKYTATAEFTILAGITLDPSSANVGDTVSITGNGFRSSRLITLTLDDEEVDSRPVSIRSDSMGCFEVDFIVPPSTSGVHKVRTDDGSEIAEVSFTTLSTISLSPTGGPINAEVTIKGTGFGSSRVVTIEFDDNHVRTIATDVKGNFTTQFVVPQNRSGKYNVVASDGVATAGAIFTVTTSIGVTPVTGHVGTVITVNGTGFTGAVTVKYDDLVVATTTADANGAFSISFNAPKSIHGHHTVTVSGVINTIEATFTMESDAPPAPTLLLPENGARQNSRSSFSWGVVNDPSGITYTLQIANDDSFNTLLLEKQGLTQSPYKLSGEEGLSSTDSDAPYYWRVKAVDGASNESAWSTPRSFYVRFIPQWAIYVIIAVIAVVISVFATRRVYRRS